MMREGEREIIKGGRMVRRGRRMKVLEGTKVEWKKKKGQKLREEEEEAGKREKG